MKNLAIIPARGGSKRIPRKNIKDFLGSPIIKYSIDAAIGSGCFDEVMVSTDDKEIAQIAKSFGAKIPFLRAAESSTDKSILLEVIIEVLKDYKKIGKTFDNVCLILSTAPFVTPKTLKNACDVFLNSSADTLIPVVAYGYPIERALTIKDGRLKMIKSENVDKNSQEFTSCYHDAGQFYFLNVKNFLKEKRIFAKNSVPFILDELQVQDIDNEEDWKIAEFKYKIQKEF